MRWNFWSPRSEGAKARAEHSRWLTRAMRQSPGVYPRIPTRRVDEGGYARLINRPGGEDRARLWWELALSRVER